MRVRIRLAEELRARLTEHVPLSGESVWNDSNVTCLLHQLLVVSASGIENDWQQTATFKGSMRAELHSVELDNRVVEPLISNLLHDVLTLLPAPDAAAGDLSENVRAVLSEWSEDVRDGQRISVLHFSVDGSLVRKLGSSGRPVLYASQAPAIGLAHEGDYFEVS